LLEVINLSALEIVKGDTSYGYVAYYAMEVHNSESKLVNLDGYVFYPYNGVNYLVSYTGTDTDLVLPANYNGQNYEIYKYAFYGNNNITSITIPETVYKIHQYAFGEMKNLQRVTFAENCICTEIGESAFYGCNNMVNFTIPDHVRTIGASAFYNCYNLTSVTVGSSVTSINSYAFQNCYKLAEVINKSNLNIWASSGSSSYGYIGAYAIEVHNGESKLINQNGYLFYPFGSGFLVNYVGSDTELALPADCGGYTTYAIWNYAFYENDNITSAVIPKDVVSIGYYAFAYCDNLESVTMGDGLASIQSYAFAYNDKLTNITFGEGFPGLGLSIGSYAFYDCDGLVSIELPSTTSSIGSSAFNSCDKLEHITIGDGATSIGYEAFGYCSALKSIKIGANITSIGSNAFANCTNLKIIYVNSPTIAGELTYATACGSLIRNAEVILVEKSITNPADFIISTFFYSEELNYEGTDYISYALHTHIWEDCSVERVQCERDGFDGSKCTSCGLLKGNTNPAHAYTPHSANDNEYHWDVCANCGAIDNKIRHFGNSGEITTPATHISTGVMTYTCGVCSKIYTETIEKVAEHNYGEWIETVAPGCSTTGILAHYHCECGLDFDAEKNVLADLTIPMRGHYVSQIGKEMVDSYTEKNDAIYPFTPTTGWYASSNHTHSTTSTFEINAIYDCTLVLKYTVSSERSCDKLTIRHNATTKDAISGNISEKTITLTLKAGDIVYITYTKDGSSSSGTDTGLFKIESCTQTEIDTTVYVSTDDVDPTCTGAVICESCHQTIKAALGHINSETVVENRVEPNCTTNGSYDNVVYCSVCSAEVSRETKIIDKLGHNYETEWTVDVAPACTTVGSKSYHCSRCSDKANVTEIPATGHSYGDWYETKAPTCTVTGTDEHECSVCHNKETRTVDALGHNHSTEWTVDTAPTCTTAGSKSHHCSRCSDKADVTEIPATGHSYGDWYETKAPTCTATGTDEHECSVCHNKETRTVDALGHNHSAEWTVDTAPTCTTVGSKSHHCSRCSDKADITELPATGHSYGDWYETKAPTCTATGTDEHECSVCHNKEARMTDAKGHTNATAVIESKVNETCTADGSYDSVIYCSVCSAEISREAKIIDKLGHDYETEWTVDVAPACTTVGSKSYHCSRCSDKANVTEIPATGHSYGDWYETKAPTCTVTGTDEHECSVCHNKETRTVDALGHNHSTEWTVDTAPTCTTAGSKSHHCSRCSDKADVTEIPATGHSYGDWYETKAPTCTATGTDEHECSVCHNKETRTVDALGHNHSAEWTVDTAPTCTTVGSKSHHCSRCSDKADITELPATGHSYGDWYETKAPTCTATGTDEHECSVCHNKEARMTDAKGHTNAEAVVENKVDSNCTTDGSYDSVVYCSVCNEQISRETKIIDKLGHDYETEWTVDVAPACTTVGSKSHHCSRCDDKANVTEIPANGHTDAVPVVENSVDATCTTNGHYDSVVYCSSCNKELSREQKIVSMKNHIEVVDTAVAPTCTTTGLTEGKHCSACDEILVAQNEIAMVDHNYGDWIVTKQETTTEDGIREKICSICGDKITTFIPATGEEVTNPDSDNATPPKEEDKNDNATELSGSAVAAIVISSVAVAGGGGFSLFWFVIKKKSASNLLMVLKGSASKSLAVLKESTSKLLSVLRKK